MTWTQLSVVLVVLLAISARRSFVATAPLSTESGSPEVAPDYQDDSVKELEDLKQSLDKTLEMMQTHAVVFSDVNGKKEAHAESKEEINQNGNLVASIGRNVDSEAPDSSGNPSAQVVTKVDIPSKGIHKSVVQHVGPEKETTDNGNRRSSSNFDVSQDRNGVEKIGSYSGIQYSPLDMAEYVFWTGDEKGVTLAIEEFLQEGLMAREEAISFLQEIKYNLDYLQNHYTRLGLNSRDHSKDKMQAGSFFNIKPAPKKPQQTDQFDANQRRQEVKKNHVVEPPTTFSKAAEEEARDQLGRDDEYDELLERLRVADFLYTEYSLEEVIYQLAKVMFAQSLTRGSSESQQALQKFTSFLEIEAEQGRISRALEKKVLDVLIAALTDTLNEHPELTSGHDVNSMQSRIEGQNLFAQILALSPEDKTAVREALAPYTNQNRSPVPIELKDAKNPTHLSLGIGKFKNP